MQWYSTFDSTFQDTEYFTEFKQLEFSSFKTNFDCLLSEDRREIINTNDWTCTDYPDSSKVR